MHVLNYVVDNKSIDHKRTMFIQFCVKAYLTQFRFVLSLFLVANLA